MSPAQTKKYWCLWGQVRKALTQLGEYSAADADAERSSITVEALGHAKSSKEFTDSDLDKIFDAFESILVVLKGPGTHDRTTQGPRARRIWVIEQLGLDDPYIAAITRDGEAKTADWRSLTAPQLTRLIYTLKRTIRASKAARPGLRA